MAILQSIMQLLVALFGVLAGGVTFLASLTKLIQAIVELTKEIRKGRTDSPGATRRQLPEAGDGKPASPNGTAPNGTAPNGNGRTNGNGRAPGKGLLRDLGRAIAHGKQKYIEIRPREQESPAERGEEKSKE